MCAPPLDERPRCAFCRAAPTFHRREPTIFGAADVCQNCLRHYRDQLAWAVAELNREGQNSRQTRDHAYRFLVRRV